MAKRTILGFVGTNDYVPVRYVLFGRVTAEPERFTSAALVSVLPMFDAGQARVVLLATAEAEAMHGADLVARLVALGVPAGGVDIVPIPSGHRESDLWELFTRIGEQLAPDEHVIFDVTHGFRSFPIVGTLALAHLREARGVHLDGVFYGAFEALGPVREVRERHERGEHVDPAPFFDLTPMFELPQWTQAVHTWRHTGRAEGLTDVAEAPLGDLEDQLRGATPAAIRRLPGALQTLSDALLVIRQDRIPNLARKLLATLTDARAELERIRPRLAPYLTLLDQLGASIGPLAQDQRADPDRQLAIVAWYLDRKRLSEAATLLRQTHTAIAGWVAEHVASLTSVADRDHRAIPAHDADRYADAAYGACFVDPAPSPARDAMRAIGARAGIDPRALAQRARDLRNPINHTWSRRNDGSSRFNADTVDAMMDQLRTLLADTRALWHAAREAAATPPPP